MTLLSNVLLWNRSESNMLSPLMTHTNSVIQGAPTVVAPLFVLGQHHGHPQADTGRATGDQHHFLSGTRHGAPLPPSTLRTMKCWTEARAAVRGSEKTGSHGRSATQWDYLTGTRSARSSGIFFLFFFLFHDGTEGAHGVNVKPPNFLLILSVWPYLAVSVL